jgi:serine protease Do
MARRVVESLIKEGKVVRGYLGVILFPLEPPLARKLNVPNNQGALIGDVQPGSPAAHAGLRRGDVIARIADREVANLASLRNLTAGLDVGSKVSVIYYRDGKSQTASVTIAELPATPEVLSSLGFDLRERAADGDGSGRILEIDRVVTGGPAFQAGLRPGMRILSVSERRDPVNTLVDFEVAVRRLGPEQGLVLEVQLADGRSGRLQIGNARDNRDNDRR